MSGGGAPAERAVTTPEPSAMIRPGAEAVGPMLRRWPGDVAALCAGALVPLAFAPFNVYPLAVVAVAALFLLWDGVPAPRALWRGWLFGIGQFGVGVSWVFVSIDRYGSTGPLVATAVTVVFVAYLALYPALLGFGAGRLTAAKGAARWLLVIPAGWVLLEWLRGWLLTGFPWLDLGYSQIDGPLAGLAPVLGVYGVSWAVALSAGLLALAARGPTRARLVCLLAVAALWVGCGLIGRIDWVHPLGGPLRVSLVQGNIPQDIKWRPEQAAATLAIYHRLSEREWGRDLIVWPETAVPRFYDELADTYIAALAARSRASGTDVMFGVPLYSPVTDQYFNGVAVVGKNHGFYRKRHLVPFGEYFPLRAALRWLNIMRVPMADFSPGRADQPLLHAAGYPVDVSICYEIAYPALIRQGLPAAAYLVTVSDDAWFGDSLAPHQHMQIARMRARETGRYLLRATNTGISGVVDAHGRLLETAPQFKEAVLRAKIVPLGGATPFVRWGSGVVLAAAALALLAGGIWSARGAG